MKQRFGKKFFLVILLASLVTMVLWGVGEVYLLMQHVVEAKQTEESAAEHVVETVLFQHEQQWIGDIRMVVSAILAQEASVQNALSFSRGGDQRVGNNIIRDFYYGRADIFSSIKIYNDRCELKYSFAKGVEQRLTGREVLLDRDGINDIAGDECSVSGRDASVVMYRCRFVQSTLVGQDIKGYAEFGIYRNAMEALVEQALKAFVGSSHKSYAYSVVNADGLLFGASDEGGHELSDGVQSSVLGGVRLTVVLIGNENAKIVSKALRQFGIMALLTIGVSVGVSWLLSRYVSQPIEKLLSKMILVRNGNSAEMSLSSDDEIRDLSSAIEGMRAAINRDKENKMLAAMGGFASHIAHDMRSPLAVLRAFVVNGDNVADERYRGAAKRSVDKLLNMADDLIDYVKAKMTERNVVDLAVIIHDIIFDGQQSDLGAHGTIIDIDVPDVLLVNIDKRKIERALVNIVHNAMEAISTRPGRVLISASSEGNKCLLITVDDNGDGIEEEHLERIFESFFSVGKKCGTGLGLAYCKQVVEAHGGTIEVQSEVGKGSTFTIRIPNCVVSKEDARLQQTSLSAFGDRQLLVPSTVLALKEFAPHRDAPLLPWPVAEAGKRYLIIDDDPAMRTLMKKMIDEAGGKVVISAAAPDDVLFNRNITDKTIDAAMVDYHFEGSEANGIDLVRFLKARGIATIHLCTGYADDTDVQQRALDAGAAGVIPKPALA